MRVGAGDYSIKSGAARRHRVHRRERRRTGRQASQAEASKTDQVRFAARVATFVQRTGGAALSLPRSLDAPLAPLDRHGNPHLQEKRRIEDGADASMRP
jgi:hypothetical protein